jgi:hypothetical protein
MTAPFAQWAPDVANVDGDVTASVRNVLPGARSYTPCPSLSAYATAALPTAALGLVSARQTSGGFVIYAGTQTKLYKFSTSSWTDVTRLSGGNYGVPSSEFWRFAQFGDNLIAVNGLDNPQTIGVTSGANFALLAGSPPVARNVTVVGDFVVLSSIAATQQRVQWSALNDSTGWTVGTNLSDYQDFPDGGRVTGVAGGKVGYVLQEYAINRMRFTGNPDYVFDFEKVVDGKGSLSPYGFTTVGGVVYFLSEDGFYAYSGSGLNPIGASRVNQWFLSNCDTVRLSSVYCVADPYRPRILWAFYSTPNQTAFDKLLIYDWQLDKWTYADITAQIWGAAASPGITLDSLTSTPLDSLTVPFDSRFYEGGRPTLAAINSSKQLAFLEGAALEALIETQELHASGRPGTRSFITEVRPLVDASGVTVRVGKRERYSDTVTYGASVAMTASGRCPYRSSGRLHRIEVTIPAGASWNHAIGVDIDANPDGAR